MRPRASRTPDNAETLRDCRGTQRGPQQLDLRYVDADGSTLVFAGGLRLRAAAPASFRVPCRHADGQHQLAGGLASVELLTAHAQDHPADTMFRQVGLDGQQLSRAARQPVWRGDGQHVAVAGESRRA